jgi:trimeric autotransporter adhesin
VVSRVLGAGEPAFWVSGRGVDLRARNARQGLVFRFGRGGVVASGAGSSVWLGLRGVGRGGVVRPVRSVVPVGSRNRVVYRVGGGLVQWFANGPLGLEQGFSLRRRVAGRGGAPLSLVLGLGGRGLRRVVEGGGRDVVLVRAGGAVLRFGGLVVRDARGRGVRAWFGVRSGRLVIGVDDRGARYPLVVDPVLESAKLTASDQIGGEDLGGAIAISGNTIVAGADAATINGKAGQGELYVFTKAASGWQNATETAELTASDGVAGDGLGTSVAISGSTIVAGSPYAAIGGLQARGAVYVFTEGASGWSSETQTAELTASDGAADDRLGLSV